MRLLLLSLMGLLMDGEAFNAVQGPRPIVFTLHPLHPSRIRIQQNVMISHGLRRTFPMRFVPSRGPVIPSTESHSVSDKPSISYIPGSSTVNYKPSSFGEAQNPSAFDQDSHPTVFDEQRNPSGSLQPSNTPGFNPSHESSSFHEERNPSAFNQDFKPSSFEGSNNPSSFEDSNNPSSFEDNNKSSSFGKDQTPFGQDNKPSFPDKHESHPDRNPVCNLLPDVGTCRAALPRYYFDSETGTCNCFLFGGCREDGEGESPGSFFTLEECHQECRPPKLQEGPVCKEIFKEDKFISYLVEPLPQNTKTDHLSDDEFLESFHK